MEKDPNSKRNSCVPSLEPLIQAVATGSLGSVAGLEEINRYCEENNTTPFDLLLDHSLEINNTSDTY